MIRYLVLKQTLQLYGVMHLELYRSDDNVLEVNVCCHLADNGNLAVNMVQCIIKNGRSGDYQKTADFINIRIRITLTWCNSSILCGVCTRLSGQASM